MLPEGPCMPGLNCDGSLRPEIRWNPAGWVVSMGGG